MSPADLDSLGEDLGVLFEDAESWYGELGALAGGTTLSWLPKEFIEICTDPPWDKVAKLRSLTLGFTPISLPPDDGSVTMKLSSNKI